MKKILLTLQLILILTVIFSDKALSQSQQNGTILITGSRFTYPLLEKWISEFKSQYPDIHIRILPRASASEDSANLIINAHVLQPAEIKPGYSVVNISRYAILPISNPQNPLLSEFTSNGIKEKEIKELYFQDYEAFHDETKKEKKKTRFIPNLYTREQKACAPTAFAAHFGLKQENIKGKGISGEDKHLIPMVKRDPNGLSYNVLNWIYDLKTRQVTDGIAVLPIDLNNNGKLDNDEKIYHNLDELIKTAEEGNAERIPVDYVNISYPSISGSANNNLRLFVNYILNQGQNYLHEYGFINPEKDVLALQKEIAELSFKSK